MTELTVRTETANMLMNHQIMASLQTFSELMASGKATVPAHLRGSPADCMAVAMQAAQWGMNPFAVAQKTHLVNGTLGYEAQLVNAVVQSSGAIVGRFHYEYSGDGAALACRVGAIPAGESAVVWGEWLRVSDVQTKNSPLWKTNQRQQMGYLQVKNWARLYCPGAILGIYTPDELEPVNQAERDITPIEEVKRHTSAHERIKSVTQKSDQPADNPAAFEPVPDPAFAQLMEEISMCEQSSDFEKTKKRILDAFDKKSGEGQSLIAAFNSKHNAWKASQNNPAAE